jgi:flavin reductase (DIM6/NTAB) family NADH-FMN oxidoreductase RutF
VLPIGDSFVVFGRVVHVAIDADMLEDGRPQADRLEPLARLGANEWSELGKIRGITRIPFDDWPGHYDQG